MKNEDVLSIDKISEVLGVNVRSRDRTVAIVRARQGAWLYYYINGYTYQEVADMFSFSRQGVVKGVKWYDKQLVEEDRYATEIWQKFKEYL